MNIKTAKYRVGPSGVAIIEVKLENNENVILNVPQDPANTEYIAIQEWVAEGNKIEEAD
tara:strand:+ start:332 stop:508 length:177 start_codon:yes stop_codon:yes gene_type:complete